ncbi:MAG: hypothetical protein V9H69_20315 [Anaerolineae bacterium]
MTSKFKSALLVLSLLLMAVGVASAAPDEIPVSSITIAVVDATGATTALVPVTAQSVGAPGARGFDLWINYDHANLSLSVATSEVGTDMAALGCGFGLGETFDDGSQKLISGFCTSGTAAATGANIQLMRLRFNLIGNPGVYPITMPATVLGQPSQLTGSQGNIGIPAQYIPGQLTIGTPTAVELSNISATTNSPAPFAASAWPLLAGAAAVAAGGAYALLRRKSS